MLFICWWSSGLELDFKPRHHETVVTCTFHHCSLFSICRLSRPTSHSSLPCIFRKLEERTTWSTWAILRTSFGKTKLCYIESEIYRKKLELMIFLLYSLSRDIESSEEMRDYDRVCIYVDSDFQAEDSFTVRHAELLTHLSTRGRHSPCYNYCICSLFSVR